MPVMLKDRLKDLIELDWKRLFKLSQDEVLGLDIGSSTVGLMQMRKDGAGYTVTAAEVADIAAGEYDGNRREINTIGAIHQCLELTGVQTRLAVCGVSGPEVAVRDFRFPSLPPGEVEGAVLLEAAQVCPFNIEESTVDYQLMSDSNDGVCGVLVAATNKVIKSKTQLTEGAYLACVLVDVDGLALLNCFSGCEERQAGQTTAILNVGSSYTNLAIMSDNALPFIRDMAYAGDDMLSQIAIESGISPEAVKGILSGSEGSTVEQLELRDSLEKGCQKLIVDVAETLRYYAAQEKSTLVDKIFVCGDFALVGGFIELLNSRLPAEAVLWNPFEKMRCDAGRRCEDILQERGPAMAVAAGLAMRSI